jgi:hypothetical protein
MKFTNILQVILLILITMLTISIVKFKLYDPVVLASVADTARAYYYTRNEESSIVVPMRKESNSRYVKAFQDLPEDFLYTGHMLIFNSSKDKDLDEFINESFHYTRYLKLKDYKKRFLETNNIDGNVIKANTFISVPGIVGNLIYNLDFNRERELVPARTLYYTGKSITSTKLLAQIPNYKAAGINAVCFDVKDIPGTISYNSKVPIVNELGSDKYNYTDDMTKIVRFLKSHDIYVIARIACFRDIHVTKKRPDWAIRSASTGGIWELGKGEIWLDPTNKYAQDYTIEVAKEAAALGVDEIQFDYIRFPTSGDQNDAIFAYSYGKMSRQETIRDFLKRAYTELQPFKVLVSIDIFGVVAWGYKGDIQRTGQDIAMLAPYCDVISPMLYPSHFNDNFRGYKKPGDNPYYFIAEGVKRVQEKAPDTAVRPWLQAFAWRVTNYNPEYIQKQIKASLDTNASGYLFWNAKNQYSEVLRGMNELPAGMK